MTGPLFSPSWYRVADLTPRLRGHAQIHRHRFRGETWYILEDLSTERFHRFSPAAYFVIGLMDGRRTVQEIWEIARERLGDDSPTQEETIHLLSQLHAVDVLQCNVPPDTAELLERYERGMRKKWQSRLLSPLSWRFPLFDPERFLGRFLPMVRPLVSWPGTLLWIAVVGTAWVLAAVHWTELTQNVMDRLLAPQNLVLLWFLFPVIKVAHEFGHAFVTRVFGGEVHEMGVMILVLTPIPYVDASSAWGFHEKRRRIAVGAAGMIVEMAIAALALFVWLNAEPGAVRTLAYNTMLIAGVSTLLFNGNPLLRYDGYYILMDLLEIPNLRTRSTAYMRYLCERYLFGRVEAELPDASPSERAWFVVYGVASFLYRLFLVAAILLFIAGQFFFIGLVLAGAAAIAWTLVPAVKGVAFLLTNPRLRSVRGRAIGVTAILVAAVLVVVCLVPVPLRSTTEGVIWMPEEAFVRAGVEGFIEEVVGRPGARVHPGDILIVSRDPALTTEVKVSEARVRELEARYTEQRHADRVKAAIIQEELQYERERLKRARQRAGELIIRSRAEGAFIAPLAADLPGRFVRKGEQLAQVVDLEKITVRTVVTQVNIDLVRNQTKQVEVRLASRLPDIIPAVITRVVPGATDQLPSTALGSQGGGPVAIDPTNAKGIQSVEKLFHVDLELPMRVTNRVGGRVYVLFDHGREPLVKQWYRRLRQLFLSRFNV